MKRKVYEAITKSWEYYKKYSQQEPFNEEEAFEEARKIAFESPLRRLQQDLLFAVMDQIGREKECHK